MKLTKKDIKNIEKLIEISVTASGQIDDGPNVFFGTRKGYKNWANKNAKLINFFIDKYYVKDVVDDIEPEGEPEWGNNYNRTFAQNKKIMDKFADLIGYTVHDYLVKKHAYSDVTGDYVNNKNESRLFKEIGLDKMVYERKL